MKLNGGKFWQNLGRPCKVLVARTIISMKRTSLLLYRKPKKLDKNIRQDYIVIFIYHFVEEWIKRLVSSPLALLTDIFVVFQLAFCG